MKPNLRKDVKQRQAKLMLEIINLMRDPEYSKGPVKFLTICELTDKLSQLNDTKNRAVNSAVVRVYLREVKGYDV